LGRHLESPERRARFRDLRAPAPQGIATEKDNRLKAVLIDSDVLVEVSRGRDENTLARWDDLSRTDAVILYSPVTAAEIWHGARPHEHRAIEALFGVMTCVSIDAEIGRRAGEYLRQYAKSHHVELGDALIAATAALHRLALWTRNQKHYPMKEITLF
jgi:predicted nucleic acid-binding protein